MAPTDPAELCRWYDAYGPALVLYARQLLAPASAEDVVQDVFVRLMAQRRCPDHVRAWLFRSVRNAAISRIRSRSRRRRLDRQRAAQRPEAFEVRPDELIDARAAQNVLESLPGDLREVVVLRIWADMTLTEISEILGGSPATVLRRYRAGLAAIRKGMKASCEKKRP